MCKRECDREPEPARSPPRTPRAHARACSTQVQGRRAACPSGCARRHHTRGAGTQRRGSSSCPRCRRRARCVLCFIFSFSVPPLNARARRACPSPRRTLCPDCPPLCALLSAADALVCLRDSTGTVHVGAHADGAHIPRFVHLPTGSTSKDADVCAGSGGILGRAGYIDPMLSVRIQNKINWLLSMGWRYILQRTI